MGGDSGGGGGGGKGEGGRGRVYDSGFVSSCESKFQWSRPLV